MKFANPQAKAELKGSTSSQAPVSASTSSATLPEMNPLERSLDSVDEDPEPEQRVRANSTESLRTRSESISSKLAQVSTGWRTLPDARKPNLGT